MGEPVEGCGMGGCGRQDLMSLPQGSGADVPTLQVIDVGDFTMYQEDSGSISPPGNILTYRRDGRWVGVGYTHLCQRKWHIRV